MKKILVVEDDPAAADFYAEVLTDAGYAADKAYDGAQALEKIKSFAPDLITLDMDLPVKGGTLVYAGMRRDPVLRDTPVIVVSGVGPRPPALPHAVPVLQKPVAPAQLLSLVERALA